MKPLITRPILITKKMPGMEDFAATARTLGYNIRVQAIQANQVPGAVAHPAGDEVYMAWGGAYRRRTADQWKPNPHVIFSELGYIPHYNSMMVDAYGHGARSALATANIPKPSAEELAWLEYYLNRYYFRDTQPAPIGTPLPYVLCILQIPTDTVITYDTAQEWQWTAGDVPEWIYDAADSLPIGYQLVVKHHPMQRRYCQKHPRTTEVHNTLDENNHALNLRLLRGAAALLTCNSSMVFEAMVHDKPIFTLGLGVYGDRGLTYPVKSWDDWFDTGMPVPDYEPFLVECCRYRQVLKDEASNPDVVARVMARLEQEYNSRWC